MKHSAQAPAKAILARNPWILGPVQDLLFFILPPLLILPLVWLLKQGFAPENIALYVLGIGGFGHHLPGFIRAYSDRELFRQFRHRFIVVPALLILIAGLYSFLNLNALACITIAWGTWHGAMQINGFARIYDSKVGSFSPATAWLDWLMCLAWFGLAILQSPTKQFSLVTQFYISGGDLIPPAFFPLFRGFWNIGTAVITVLFLENARRQWKAGTPPSPLKILVMLSGFAFWWYCVASVSNLLLGVLMWEIFHDIQYNALVWRFQRNRVDAGHSVGAFERMLFLPGWKRIVVYSGLIVAYGLIGVFTSFRDVNTPEKILLGDGASQWLLRITLVSALLHFYYDGFIWRIRQAEIRQGLGLTTQKSGQPGAPTAPTIRLPKFTAHAWKWAFFLIPVAYLGWSQYHQRAPQFEDQVVNLSEAIPGSWLAHFLAGTYFKGQGQLDRAEAEYARTVQYNPDFTEGQLFYADMLYRKGDLFGAAEHYRMAVAREPENTEMRKNLGYLYLTLEQPVLAALQFQAALEMDPSNPDLHYGLASALLRQNRMVEAEAHIRAVLAQIPAHSGALNYLGMIHDLSGDLTGAISYYQQSLASDSANASARQNLAAALQKQQDKVEVP